MMLGPSLIVLILIVLLLVLVPILIITMTARGRRVMQPSCGSCGYAVAGLEAMRCPECGSDLREVGIITPQTRQGVPPAVWAAMFTVFLPIPALIVSGVVASALPPLYRFSIQTTLLRPGSGGYNSVIINGSGSGQAGVERAEIVELQLIPSDGRATPRLMYDPAQNEVTTGPPNRETLGELSTDAVRSWLAMCGVDVEHPGIIAEVSDMTRIIRMVENGSSGGGSSAFGGIQSGSSSGSAPRTWLTVLLLSFWGVVWLLGVWLILRRGRHTSKPA